MPNVIPVTVWTEPWPDLPLSHVAPTPSGSQSAGGSAFSNSAKCGMKFRAMKNKFLTCGSIGFMVT